MAFTITQQTNTAQFNGINVRYTNNAPISSLYTLYANGSGGTYWSTSMNPSTFDKFSTTQGNINSTFTGNMAALSNTDSNASTKIARAVLNTDFATQ